jgi:hypothetical protein
MRPIHVRAGWRALAGHVYGPATARAGILFVHGIDSKTGLAWDAGRRIR